MRKFIMLLVVLVFVLSFNTFAFAANPTDASTNVTYEGKGVEEYTITVPALLAPGNSGNVVLKGTYSSNRKVTVSSDKTVTLTNSIKASDKKTLNVTFEGITLTGDNNTEVTSTKSVSVAEITDALFGSWSGTFNYSVAISDVN